MGFQVVRVYKISESLLNLFRQEGWVENGEKEMAKEELKLPSDDQNISFRQIWSCNDFFMTEMEFY